MAELRLPAVLGVLAALCGTAAGCSDSSGSTASSHYNVARLKAAYLRPPATPEPDLSYWVNPNDHSHADFVPVGAVEICPVTQRADVPAGSQGVHIVTPKGGQPTGQLVLEATAGDDHQTPRITQSALVFGTTAIAEGAMAKVQAAMAKCPASYSVRGGPPQILGTYALTSRPLEVEGWKGVAQQLAHSYQGDQIFYEDVGHVVLQRGNAIVDLLLSHEHVVGDRADSVDLAEQVAKRIAQRLGA